MAAAVGASAGQLGQLLEFFVSQRVLDPGGVSEAGLRIAWPSLVVTAALVATVAAVGSAVGCRLRALAPDASAGIVAAVSSLIVLAHPLFSGRPMCGNGLDQLLSEHLW
jgi:hypothetical protein